MGWEAEIWQKGRLLSRVTSHIEFIDLVRLRAASAITRTLFLPHERIVNELAARAHGVGSASISVVHAIGNVARRGNAIAVSAVKEQLAYPEVREEALLALGLVAHRGDSASVLAATAHLEDKNPLVRRAAVATVGALADEGDALYVSRAAKLFEDEVVQVREAALRAIINIVGADTEDTNAVLCQRLRHESMQVRHAAAVALGRVAESGDMLVALALATCAQESNQDVRRAVVPALGRVAERADAATILGLLACLEDSDVVCRQNAVDVIMLLATRGDRTTVQLLCDRLRHEDTDVREAVVLMLGKLANDDDPMVISALQECAMRSDERVRSAVKLALEGVIHVVNSRAISALAASLMSIDGDSRRYAAQAFLKGTEREFKEGFLEKDHRDAVFELGALLEDNCQIIRETAMFTIEAIVEKKHVFGTSEVGVLKWETDPQLLQQRQLMVRRFAHCLGEQDFLLSHVAKKMILAIAKPGDGISFWAVVGQAEHQSWQVRLASLELMSLLARPGDGQALHVAVERLRDESSTVREQAVEVLRACQHLTKVDKLIVEVGELLADDDINTRDAAVDALHALAPVSKLSKAVALSTLQMQLEHPNWHVRKTCVTALGRFVLAGILPCNSIAFRRVEALLTDDSWLVRNAATSTLGGLIEYSRSDGAHLVSLSETASPPEDVEYSSKSSPRGGVEQALSNVRSSLTESNLLVPANKWGASAGPSSRMATAHTSRASTRVTTPTLSVYEEECSQAITSAVAALRNAALQDVDCRVQQVAADTLNRVSVEEIC